MAERVCAGVVPKPGQGVTLEDVTSHLRERQIASYKHPERLVQLEELPRSPLGKLLRRELEACIGARDEA